MNSLHKGNPRSHTYMTVTCGTYRIVSRFGNIHSRVEKCDLRCNLPKIDAETNILSHPWGFDQEEATLVDNE